MTELIQAGFTLFMAGIILFVLALTAREIERHRQGRNEIGTGHLVLRLVGGGLVLSLLVAVLLGGLWHLQPEPIAIRSSLSYWTRCSVLGWMACMVGFADLQMVRRHYRRRRQQRRRQHAMTDLLKPPNQSDD